MIGSKEAGKRTRVFIVEDDMTVLRAVERAMLADPRVALVAACHDRTSAEAAIDRGISFEAALVDLGLPDGSGIDVVRKMSAKQPQASILVFSKFEDDENLFNAFEAGAVGYLLKDTPPEKLIASLLDAERGGTPLSDGLARRIVKAFSRGTDESHGLTAREMDVLRALCKGHTYSEVGEQLGVGLSTVQTHVKSIYMKLQVRSKAEATRAALDRGIVR